TTTYWAVFVFRFTIAARSARLSATRSLLLSRDTARSRGHEIPPAPVGGKLCGAGAPTAVPSGTACGAGTPPGGGTGITPARTALPVDLLYVNTWITSPPTPGVPGGDFSSWSGESLSPETNAVLPSGDIAIPP